MNKHFEDAAYYLKRAGETAKVGLSEEIGRAEARVRELTGRETDPEPNRLEEIRTELTNLQNRAEGEAREAIVDARERLDRSRKQEA